MLRVKFVEPKPQYRLLLQFTNGETRVFDMNPYLKYPVFSPLSDINIFNLAKVDYGTVTWPGEIDIAPETLYEYSDKLKDTNKVG
jgi:hypothetical protein